MASALASNFALDPASGTDACPASLAQSGDGAHMCAMHSPHALDIQVNGEPRRLDAVTVAGLLDTLGLDRRKVAVERNEAIVPRSLYDTTELAQGDRFEIVHFIGGG